MPKNLLNFGRRKSSGNILEPFPTTTTSSTEPAQTSFRVLERPRQPATDGERTITTKAAANRFHSPLLALRGKSADELVLRTDRWAHTAVERVKERPLTHNRGSGGTTNSGSSGHYDSSAASARYSSTSTLPSSVDHEVEEDLFTARPHKSSTMPMPMPQEAHAEDALPSVPSFATRTSRALSFGLKGKMSSAQSNKSFNVIHSARNSEEPMSPHRARAETASSYASTAVPPRLESKPIITAGDFADEFGDLFDRRQNKPLPEEPSSAPAPPPHAFHRTDSEPMYPPRTYSRNGFTPSPNFLDSSRRSNSSPYQDEDYNGNQERESFLSNSSVGSPYSPVPPAHLSNFKAAIGGYAPLGERQSSPGFERTSTDSADSYPSSIDENSREQEAAKAAPPPPPPKQLDLEDEDRYLKRHQLTDGPISKHSASSSRNSVQPPPPSSSASTLRAPPTYIPSRVDTSSPGMSDGGSLFAESSNATPRAARLQPMRSQESTLFDETPSTPQASFHRPEPDRSHSAPVGDTPKKMTKAQFEALQQQGDSAEQSEEELESEEDAYSDEDDTERVKQIARQRRKQEANMSVYRQQMKKVAGGGLTDLPVTTARPELNRSSNSAPQIGIGVLHLGGIEGKPPAETVRGKHDSDDDDDVPLGILQAHGFPGANRPPTANDPTNGARASVAGSVVGGGAGQGNLPPFARRLPQDPYFGASLVNSANRESLPFNSNGSVYGMPASTPPALMTPPIAPQMQPPLGHPGGLVGVIAGEERARAARRGSPNAAGSYNSTPMPLPSNMPSQMPRTMSMGNLPPPSAYVPSGIPPMPMMPQMPMMGMGMGMGGMQDQTQQQMQQFMQMQMQFMQNMLQLQQGQMDQQQQQPRASADFLNLPHMGQHRPISIASQQGFGPSPNPNQGRSMTMMNPPPNWGNVNLPTRPVSGMPKHYTPSVNGFNMAGGGPGPGYTPSIAPSERSNIGMPSRYRPVSNLSDVQSVSGRAQSLTSANAPHAFVNGYKSSADLLRAESPQHLQAPLDQERPVAKSTIRIVDKPKGAPKVTSRPVSSTDEDDEEGWADMKKKREHKKRFKWGRQSRDAPEEPALSDLYKNFD